MVVQVNGKLRGSFECAPDTDKDTILSMAKSVTTVQNFIGDKPIRKEIVVPLKIVNFVI